MIEQRIAIGGPLDGKIVQTPRSLPDLRHEDWDGHYRRVTMSEHVSVFMWSRAVNRWAKRKRTVTWGVPKRPFGQVESPR